MLCFSDLPARSVEQYVEGLNRLINTTVSDSRFIALFIEPSKYYITRYQSGDRLPLILNKGALHAGQFVKETEDGLELLGYSYTYSLTADLTMWLFRYEYDAQRTTLTPGEPTSHFHANGGFQFPTETNTGLNRLHFPTGLIGIEHVIWLLIDGYGVPPKEGVDILDAVKKSFVSSSLPMFGLWPNSLSFP